MERLIVIEGFKINPRIQNILHFSFFTTLIIYGSTPLFLSLNLSFPHARFHFLSLNLSKKKKNL